ncbi:hypothetical protein PanWU01x14_217660, partial [Parasponia andersonii]
ISLELLKELVRLKSIFQSVRLPCPDYKQVHEGFKEAYKEMAQKYPCFGYAAKMANILWWKTCVRDSLSGLVMTTTKRHLKRSVHEQGLTVGIISNAEYRYQDVILPALGLNQGCE